MHEKYGVLDWSRLTSYAAANTRYTNEELEQSRMRVMLYLITVTANEHTQKIGKDFIVFVEGITVGALWKAKNIWPTRINSIHLVLLYSRMSDALARNWAQFLGIVLLRYFGKCPNLILAPTREDMMRQLAQVGFPDSIVPQELGGQWSYETQTEEWMRELSQKDDERNCRILLGNSSATSERSAASPRSASQLSVDNRSVQQQHLLSQISVLEVARQESSSRRDDNELATAKGESNTTNRPRTR